MKFSILLITLAMMVHLFGHFVPAALPEHILDAELDSHMRFHVFQSSIWILGIDFLILLLAYGPFMNRQRWSVVALLVAGIPSQLAYFFAIGVFPDGAPPVGPAINALMAVTAVIFFVGVLMGGRQIFAAQ